MAPANGSNLKTKRAAKTAWAFFSEGERKGKDLVRWAERKEKH